MVTVKPA